LKAEAEMRKRSATKGVITRERACGLKAEAETTKKRARVSEEATR
tara:strand:- start:275 stop:409 length:135 start_codon:yes stop_codon:yes gene_type:complete